MKIYKKRADLTPYILSLRQSGKTIGFVPTMGALHEGHISLVERCRKDCDITVCSIFVNPTQFTDAADLQKYPRPVEHDVEALITAGCDILYLPEIADIYPDGQVLKTKFNFNGLDRILEGASRKGHFQGVAQVVRILLGIIQPDNMFLGQKDYQQYLVLSKLVQQLKLKTKVVRRPIVREKNGLAMSSRNVRLPDNLRQQAGIIFKTLKDSAKKLNKLKPAIVLNEAVNILNGQKDFKVDYFELRTADDLQTVTIFRKNKEYILITGVIVGGVRLLDNLIVKKRI